MTKSAQTAQAIRKELKASFPGIKFSVTSHNFAGGDSVHVDYDNGVPSEQVTKVVGKYEYGHFDGMTDCYEYSNGREDIPQAKYVQVQRNVTDDVRDRLKQDTAKKFGIADASDEQEWQRVFHSWSDQVIWREASSLTF